jgi:hypothetical protein
MMESACGQGNDVVNVVLDKTSLSIEVVALLIGDSQTCSFLLGHGRGLTCHPFLSALKVDSRAMPVGLVHLFWQWTGKSPGLNLWPFQFPQLSPQLLGTQLMEPSISF